MMPLILGCIFWGAGYSRFGGTCKNIDLPLTPLAVTDLTEKCIFASPRPAPAHGEDDDDHHHRSVNEFHQCRRRRIDDVRRLRLRRRDPRRDLPRHARRADKVGGRVEARRGCPRDAGASCVRRNCIYFHFPLPFILRCGIAKTNEGEILFSSPPPPPPPSLTLRVTKRALPS